MMNTEQLYNKEFRQQLRANPKQALIKLGEVQQNYEYVVHSNSKTTFYFVMPSQSLLEANLSSIQAAAVANLNNVGTAGSAGSASSVSSVTTTIGSVGSVGSLGSAGSVNFHANI